MAHHKGCLAPARMVKKLMRLHARSISGVPRAGSCTCILRIIPLARESGKILSFHHRARGVSHDSTPFFLPAGALWPPVAVCRAVLTNGVSLLQTQLSYRERHEARRVGP